MGADAERLVADLRAGFTRTASQTGLDEPAPAVEAAIARLPRERFIPSDLAERAYDDAALAVGYGATISQPFIVALMTTLAQIEAGDRVLEIGCGTGYQSALLAELGAQVWSVEIVPQLVRRSSRILRRLGYTDVDIQHGDGWRGRPRQAPFDAILVTACPPEIPSSLLEQLAPDGRLVIPVGETRHSQKLWVVHRTASGLEHTEVLPVVFVPMTGG